MLDRCAFWRKWPDDAKVEVPLLSERPPLDFHLGLEPDDRDWKEILIKKVARGETVLTGSPQHEKHKVRFLIDHFAQRTYHVARVLQCFFRNPNHGNYADPFLETLFILLTWRSHIEVASEIVEELRRQFETPMDLLNPAFSNELEMIISRSGFSAKRPEMVRQLVQRFNERFPDGNTNVMITWTDDDIIRFLTSISGIGRKSALCVLMYSFGRARFPIDAHIRRVLRRTDLLHEVFKESKELEHREYQAEVEPFVPPSVRMVLHTGLLATGKEYCHSRKPQCQKCPIHKLCHYYREAAVKIAEGRPFKHVDLFSGPGGFGQGFEGKDFRTVVAVDKSSHATRTYCLNHTSVPEGNVLELDLEVHGVDTIQRKLEKWRVLLQPGAIHVITAGIPCQGFSKAGYRTRPDAPYSVVDDPRNHLYRIVVEWTRQLLPSYVVIENVPNMQSAGDDEENILRSVKTAFENIKVRDGTKERTYSADYGTLNAADFGVAQTRERLFLIASHPSVPTATVVDLQAYHTTPTGLVEVIGHYPVTTANGGHWYTNLNNKVVIGHRARFNNDDDLKIFAAIRPGERYVDFVRRRSDIIEERRQSGRAIYSTDSFPDKYSKLLPLQPARTIVAHLQRDGNGYIHPTQTRSITPREAATIQGFQEGFVFTGSMGHQFIQIGNAVPPPVASAIARYLATKLKRTTE